MEARDYEQQRKRALVETCLIDVARFELLICCPTLYKKLLASLQPKPLNKPTPPGGPNNKKG